MDEKPQSSSRAPAWLSQSVARPDVRPRRHRLIVTVAIVFLAAFGVRLLHWQDYQLNIGADQASLVGRYKQQAQRMLDGDGILYPTGYEQHRSVQVLVHPPGYSIFIAIIYGLFGQSDDNLVLAQIVCDSLAAVLVFVIAAQLLQSAASVIAGLLVALSPHLAHQSLMLLPESLAVPPILIAVCLLVRAKKQPRLVLILTAGAMIGLSCWLRSNALLLAPFLALAILLLSERGRRLKYAATFVLATIVVISPITIRNWVVFGYFIPLSLGSGVTLIEGIADYDKENRFGMPATDDEAGRKDLEWHNRPDYAVGLWRPDGIERDRYRFARGLEVIRQNPVWFAGVMIRRAASMLRYNDSLSQGWPADTARAPIVSAEASFGHRLVTADVPGWSSSAEELLAKGKILSPGTECMLAEDRETLTVTGDDSAFDDQFSSASIAVDKHTDYVLKVPITLIEGRMAVKVTSVERGMALASHILVPPEAGSPSTGKVEAQDEELDNYSDSAIKARSLPTIDNKQHVTTLMPFATGNRSEVMLVISNNGSSSVRSKTLLGVAELYRLGETPYQWSRFVRRAVRGIERNVYKTSHMLPLIGAGIILLAVARRWWVLIVLLVVPAYYLLVQSTLHTEYRYILAMHYFLFAIAAVTLGCVGVAIKHGLRLAVSRFGLPPRKDGL